MRPASPRARSIFGASGAYPGVRHGRWWTVLSAGWLHGGILHIVFNMMSVRQLAPATADLYGPGRMVIIYTVGSVAGFLLSSTSGAFLPGMPFFGAPAHRGRVGVDLRPARRDGLLRPAQRQQHGVEPGLVVGAHRWCHRASHPGIDNYAHVGGVRRRLPGRARCSTRSSRSASTTSSSPSSAWRCRSVSIISRCSIVRGRSSRSCD